MLRSVQARRGPLLQTGLQRLRGGMPLVAPAVVSLVIAAVAVWSASGQRAFLLALLAALIPAPLALRALQKRFDLFEPIVLVVVALFVMFVIRPSAHLFYGEMTYQARSLERSFDTALLIALVGVFALYCGYFMPVARTLARQMPPLPSALRANSTIAFAGALIVIGMLLYGVYVSQVGGLDVARRLLSGRDPQTEILASQATVYFLYGQFLAIPAALLLLEAAATRRRALAAGLGALLACALVITLSGPRGDRMWIMLLGISILVLRYLRKQRRPSARTVAVIGFAAFAFGVTFLADIRVPTARSGSPTELFKQTVRNPVHGWHDFVLGGDTEMFSIVALMAERVPSSEPHKPGITLVSLATNWIPRGLYPEKPRTADEEIYAMLLPTYFSYARAGPAPSVFGGFYYDSGLPGVVAGSILVGILIRLLFEYLVVHPSGAGSRLLYAAALPLVVVLMRGNPTDTIGRMSFVVLPILVAVWFTGRHEVRTRRETGSAVAVK